MRVLHILNELKASGAEVMLARAAALWVADGIETHVLSTGSVRGEYAPILESCGVKVHHLPFKPSIPYLHALRRLVAQGAYDVVHIHPERAFFWVALAGRAAGARSIVRSVHNVFSFSGTLWLERLVQRACLRRLGVVFVSVSESVQDNEGRRFRNPTIHLRNWVDTRAFTPPDPSQRVRARNRFGLDEDDLTLVTVGNCGPAKNHGAVIEAMLCLEEEQPFYLHVGAEEASRPEYSLAVSHGVTDRCRFLGRVDDVRDVLHAADVYVMPSYYEGLGIAALEAAATGLPCVLTRVPGLSDLQTPLGDGAIWVQPDAASVAAGVLAAASIHREEQESKTHAVIDAGFSVERGAAEAARLYRSLLDRR